jgi:putative Ca2+/H+ antiporter (TMEM165/GDT1 family)
MISQMRIAGAPALALINEARAWQYARYPMSRWPAQKSVTTNGGLLPSDGSPRHAVRGWSHSPKGGQVKALPRALVAAAAVLMGDKAQVATIRSQRVSMRSLSVVSGATNCMMLVNVPAVWIGEKLATLIPTQAARLSAAKLFGVAWIITSWSACTAAI